MGKKEDTPKIDARSMKATKLMVQEIATGMPLYQVTNPTNNSHYKVYYEDKHRPTCPCPDFHHREHLDNQFRCKHIRAVELFVLKRDLGLEDVILVYKQDLPLEDEKPEPKKKEEKSKTEPTFIEDFADGEEGKTTKVVLVDTLPETNEELLETCVCGRSFKNKRGLGRHKGSCPIWKAQKEVEEEGPIPPATLTPEEDGYDGDGASGMSTPEELDLALNDIDVDIDVDKDDKDEEPSEPESGDGEPETPDDEFLSGPVRIYGKDDVKKHLYSDCPKLKDTRSKMLEENERINKNNICPDCLERSESPPEQKEEEELNVEDL